MGNEYPLFELWYKHLDWILSSIERFPKNARFSLASRIADLSLETLELIIEAIYTRQRIRILDRLNLDLEKLRVLFRLAHDRKYISGRQYRYIAQAINESGKMAGGWKKASV